MVTTTKEECIERIATLIPSGKDNAVTRSELRWRMGLSDRKVRDLIHNARVAGHLIVSTSRGYYKPDSVSDLVDYYRREKKRAISIFAGLKNARAQLKEMGVEV